MKQFEVLQQHTVQITGGGLKPLISAGMWTGILEPGGNGLTERDTNDTLAEARAFSASAAKWITVLSFHTDNNHTVYDSIIRITILIGLKWSEQLYRTCENNCVHFEDEAHSRRAPQAMKETSKLPDITIFISSHAACSDIY